MITEEQAKLKWCPMTSVARQVIERQACSINRTDAGTLHGTHCIASACMMWNFVPKTHHRNTELWSKSKGCKVNSAFGDDAEWRPVAADADKPLPDPVGYCGLAGKP